MDNPGNQHCQTLNFFLSFFYSDNVTLNVILWSQFFDVSNPIYSAFDLFPSKLWMRFHDFVDIIVAFPTKSF